MSITVSIGNSKIGGILNISLPPIKSCKPSAPCRHDCYALKAYRNYKTARTAWDNNFRSWKNDPSGFETELTAVIEKKQPIFFRWHVSGDIPAMGYLRMMIRVAEAFPGVKFLAFTKRYDFVRSLAESIPDNLQIVLSTWPCSTAPSSPKLAKFHRAWVDNGKETRIPADAIECFGDCESCGMCWNLSTLGRDIFFRIH
jgi:hypothetical protein